MSEARIRTQRLIVGALLGSNLSQKELIYISERLLYDKKWREQLAIYLRNIAEITYMSRTKADMYHEGADRDLAEEYAAEIVEMFSSKRVPKLDSLKTLKNFSRSKSWIPSPNRTVRENATELLRSLKTENEVKALLNDLADYLGYEGDPYIRGLM